MTNQNQISKAFRSITQARQSIEILSAKTPRDDEYTLGILGSLLEELRSAEETITSLHVDLLSQRDRMAKRIAGQSQLLSNLN
ncbi:MAG TPA: hypothetical protein VM260_26590 [Pirellula sp.]|nr:hypothetical protein [Pirellula sp.]